MKMINLGCGRLYHPDWINYDHDPDSEHVHQADLLKGIPQEDGSADVVYQSNILEHFRRPDADALLAECYRVLKPGGVLRIAVPDYERLCRTYLEVLAREGLSDETLDPDYEWLSIELADQFVREVPGGEMGAYFRRDSMPNEAFVVGRIGVEGERMIALTRQMAQAGPRPPAGREPLARRLREFPWVVRNWLLDRLMNDQEKKALRVGRYELSGESHQWLYDRYYLSVLLKRAGFASVKQVEPGESSIANWNSYGLELAEDGRVFKADSLYMEAHK